MSESSEVEVHSPVVEDWGELTPYEERELHRLELRVERAFSEGGVALKELRDKRAQHTPILRITVETGLGLAAVILIG